MSALTDLFHGDFGNIGHDITSHFKEDLPYYMLAGAAATGGAGLAGIGPLAGLGGAAAEGGALGALGIGEGAAAVGEGASLATGIGEGAAATETGTAALTEALPGVAESGGMTDFSAAAKVPPTGGGADPLWLQSGQQAAPAADPITSLSGPLTPDKASGGGGFFDKLITGAENSVTKNPLGTGAAALGLGMAAFGGNKNSADLQQIKDQAAQLGQQGAYLQQYLKDGTLPPGMKAQLDQATHAAKARITSNHIKSGMGGDPSMNSALAQELNSVDINAVAAMAQSQIDMMKTGLNATGLSSQLYQYLTKLEREDNKELMNSIAKFAAALGGSGGSGNKNTFSIVST